MKKKFLYAIITIILLGLIFLYPWFEIFVSFVLLMLLLSYFHYWTDKKKYGPYLHYKYNPGTTMMINWIGVDDKYKGRAEDCIVEVSKNKDFEGKVARIRCQNVTMEKGRYYYHTLVKNLVPNKGYYYRITFKDDIVYNGNKYHFQTGPSTKNYPKNVDFIKFIIYGDDQTADFIPVLAQTVNAAQYKERPKFIVHLGDINQNIWNLHENNVFFTTKKKLFRTTPYMPVIGNHDVKPITQYGAIYDIDHWYSFQYGPLLRFIILTGHHELSPNTSGQYEFLERQLNKSKEKNQFSLICIHRSAFHIQHKKSLSRPSREIRDFLVPLIKKYNKGLYRNILWFNGHQHDYCRVVKDEMTYITIGACSNAKSYLKLEENQDKYYIPEIADKEYGKQSYCLAQLSPENKELTIEVKNPLGKIIETLHYKLK